MARKKRPDFDAMTKEEVRKFVLVEMKENLRRGDRYALTRICELWTKEDIMINFMDYKNMETPEWSPKLKVTSMIFILDLWDKWDKKNANRKYYKSSNQKSSGYYRKKPKSDKKDQQNAQSSNRQADGNDGKDRSLDQSQVR